MRPNGHDENHQHRGAAGAAVPRLLDRRGSGAGKSTIAQRIATRHSMQVYCTDDVMTDHANCGTPDESPHQPDLIPR